MFGKLPSDSELEVFLDTAIERFSSVNGMSRLMENAYGNKPQITFRKNNLRTGPYGEYQREPNLILLHPSAYNIESLTEWYNRSIIGEETGHWLYYELNPDEQITGAMIDFRLRELTSTEHEILQIHEMFGGLFDLINSDGKFSYLKMDLYGTMDKDHAIGYMWAIALYNTNRISVLPDIIRMDFNEIKKFIRKEFA